MAEKDDFPLLSVYMTMCRLKRKKSDVSWLLKTYFYTFHLFWWYWVHIVQHDTKFNTNAIPFLYRETRNCIRKNIWEFKWRVCLMWNLLKGNESRTFNKIANDGLTAKYPTQLCRWKSNSVSHNLWVHIELIAIGV